jgi:Xaa-Pro aminopeptidase
MKRGYVERNSALVPDGLLASRRKKLIEQFETFGVEAAVVYGDVADADELHYFVNLSPYWGSATSIIGKDGAQALVTGMTARVNFWVSLMSGVDRAAINGAGPNVNKALVNHLREHFAAGASIGIIGDYFPGDMLDAIEAGGFKGVWMTEAARAISAAQDAGFQETLLGGIALMNGAVAKSLEGAETGGRTMQQVAADVEYACRSAGAMDALLLAGNRDLQFGKAPDRAAGEPWTLFIQLQYLGEWMVITRNSDPALNREAFAIRDAYLPGLLPGRIPASSAEQDWQLEVCPMVRSDHLNYPAEGDMTLVPGQIISLRVSNRPRGVVIEDMVLVREAGGKLLTRTTKCEEVLCP